MKSKALKSYLMAPLQKSELENKVDLKISVCGGGPSGQVGAMVHGVTRALICLLYTSPSPRDRTRSRMPSSA